MTTQQVILFEAPSGVKMVCNINNWLKYNSDCKITNMTNIDTMGKWAILAAIECNGSDISNRFQQHSEKHHTIAKL